MIQMMLKDLVYISFCFLILGTSYSILSYSLETSLRHDCCGEHGVRNFTSSSELMSELFEASWWNLFGEVGDLEGLDELGVGTMYEFMAVILLPALKGFYMLVCGIIFLNLLIAMFSHSFTSIQERSLRIWCALKHDLIFEYFDRSKLPAPFAILTLLRSLLFSFLRKLLKPFENEEKDWPKLYKVRKWVERPNRFMSAKRNFIVRLRERKEGRVWSEEGAGWAENFAKTLKRWERTIANNYWLTQNLSKKEQ